MKAIWLKDGIITNIVVNEACSSGCGSFLENFAASLKIPVEEIAKTAFDSKSPASLQSVYRIYEQQYRDRTAERESCRETLWQGCADPSLKMCLPR